MSIINRHSNQCIVVAVLGAALLAFAGCSKKEAETTPPAAEPLATEPAAATADDVPAEIEAKLAQADLLDGQADKVVTRCASCALSMDGKPDYSLKVLDYKLLFCTEGCAKSFAKDITKSVLAMKIPEE